MEKFINNFFSANFFCFFNKSKEKEGGMTISYKSGAFIIFLLFIVFTSGCGVFNSISPEITPPEWLWGVWGVEGDEDFSIYRIEVTKDNVIYEGSGVSINFKEAYKAGQIQENHTVNEYDIIVSDSSTGMDYTYNFKYISDERVDHWIGYNGYSFGPVELVKR